MAHYAIMNVGTERLHRKAGNLYEVVYETERGAKGACTRLNREYTGCEMKVENGKDVVQWVVVNYAEYCARPVKMVEKTNLMSGKKYMEAEDTPNCCSPSSETYWSM